MADSRFVEIHRTKNAIEAHLLKGELEAAGNATQITDEAVAALQMPALWWASPRILVAQHDATRASEIIRELEAIRVARSTSGNTD